MMYSWTLALAFALTAEGFTVRQPVFGVTSTLRLSATALADYSGKYFQLEELEDQDKCESEIFLNAAGTVTFGVTDGPPPADVSGTWKTTPDGNFEMKLTRNFEAGQPKSKRTDVGEFPYTVERTFTGETTEVGGLLAVQGSIHAMEDGGGDAKVGFFEMIDTTPQKNP